MAKVKKSQCCSDLILKCNFLASLLGPGAKVIKTLQKFTAVQTFLGLKSSIKEQATLGSNVIKNFRTVIYECS
jgi:hypothetical protein